MMVVTAALRVTDRRQGTSGCAAVRCFAEYIRGRRVHSCGGGGPSPLDARTRFSGEPAWKPGRNACTVRALCAPTWAETSTAACAAAGVKPPGAAAAAVRRRARPPAKSPAPPRNTARSAPSHPSSRSSPSSTLREVHGRCQWRHPLRTVTNAVARPSSWCRPQRCYAVSGAAGVAL